jgi:hypothetical protein
VPVDHGSALPGTVIAVPNSESGLLRTTHAWHDVYNET